MCTGVIKVKGGDPNIKTKMKYAASVIYLFIFLTPHCPERLPSSTVTLCACACVCLCVPMCAMCIGML